MLKQKGLYTLKRAGSSGQKHRQQAPRRESCLECGNTVPLTIHHGMRSPGEHHAALTISGRANSHPAPTRKQRLCSAGTSWEPDLPVMAVECLRQRLHKHRMGSCHVPGCPEARRPKPSVLPGWRVTLSKGPGAAGWSTGRETLQQAQSLAAPGAVLGSPVWR